METTRRLSVSATYVWEVYKKYVLPLLLWRYSDDYPHKNDNNKIDEGQKPSKHFFTAMNSQASIVIFIMAYSYGSFLWLILRSSSVLYYYRKLSLISSSSQ